MSEKNIRRGILRGILTGVTAQFILFSAAAWGGSTGKISGTISQAGSKEPIASVNILIVGTAFGVTSDLQGDYFIANVPPGIYSVKASIIGFEPVTKTDVRVRVDATTEVNFSLREAAVEVGKEIVVTAERPLIEKDNTASRTILESNDLVNRPATELTSVLATLPSVNTENGVLKVRGGTLDQVAVLIDGARARNPLDQSSFTNVNLSSIQEMEVITGSFNAEYGEAQSGVFNIVTKEGSDQYHVYTDVRYTPPGKKHWGTALYDYSSPLYWEDTHARHLEWWRDYPNQWVDPNGNYGNDPRCIWTPEQAYNNYIQTHRPLNDYTNTAGYQGELSVGGPVPLLDNVHFFLSGKYRAVPPLFGNSFRSLGKFFDGSAKVAYDAGGGRKFILSGFIGTERTSWGIDDQPDYFYALLYGIDSRYAYYDFPGLPEAQTDGQSLKFTDVLDAAKMFEIKLSRVQAYRKVGVLPGDPIGWVAVGPTLDNLRAVDSSGRQIPGGYQNKIGYHTTGYYFRNDDHNADWSLTGYYSNQVNKNWQLKSGLEFTYYNLNHFNQSKFPDRTDQHIYTPYQGAVYEQNKLEFGGLIVNAGLRYDFYNPHDMAFTNPFDPLNSPALKTATFSQLSPRVGVSHPIDERTALHFSYGHFFERGPFGDYGEGTSNDHSRGSLTTFIVDVSDPGVTMSPPPGCWATGTPNRRRPSPTRSALNATSPRIMLRKSRLTIRISRKRFASLPSSRRSVFSGPTETETTPTFAASNSRSANCPRARAGARRGDTRTSRRSSALMGAAGTRWSSLRPASGMLRAAILSCITTPA